MMMHPNNDRHSPHLTMRELARRWHQHPVNISKTWKQLGLRPIKIGRRLLFPIEQIEEYERDHKAVETSRTGGEQR